jgi:cell division protein FtsW
MLVMMRLDYHFWQRYSVLIMAGTLLLLLITLVFGKGSAEDVEGANARRWLFGGSVQPAELAKLAVAIYVADWLSSKGGQIRRVTYGLIPFAIVIGLVAGLILLQPNASTALLIVGTAVAMFFLAGADVRQLITSSFFGGGTLTLVIFQAPYRLERFKVFLTPWKDPTGTGYQQLISLAALTAGGLLGRGLGNGQLKLSLPLAHNDAIFAVLFEELGLIGCLVVIGLFTALAYRGSRIALKAPDTYGMVLATGITSWIILQTLIHVAAVSSSMPFTGMPLPFISYGGSSLTILLAAVGLLVSISRGSRQAPANDYASFDFGWRHRRARLSRTRRS